MAIDTPIIAGEVYTADFNGSPEEILCLATVVTQGTKFGLFRRVNMAFDRFEEGTDDMVGWSLKKKAAPPTARKAGRPKKTQAVAIAK
tara:strand:- start:2519 stop:2782 length:264 start_codon:yes stop_codon:yes gene_type:complete